MQWYYAFEKQKKGPFSNEEFNGLIINGTITSKTLVWNQTFENWQRFETIEYQIDEPEHEVTIIPEKDEFGESIKITDPANEITAKANINGQSLKDGFLNHKISFSGAAGEYFKIWIQNLFLTIVTAGIYAAWAKVRTKKYFYSNTKLNGETFDYLANPVEILKGNLVVVGVLILFSLISTYMPQLNFFLILLFLGLFPFFIYRSFCFSAKNISYQNIKFNFTGTIGESYKIFALFPLLFPLTLGLIAPYWQFRLKKYIFENFSFGSSKNIFNGKPGFFYETILLAVGIMLLVMIVFVIIVTAAGAAASAFNLHLSSNMIMFRGSMVILSILFYIGMVIIGVVLQTFIYTKLTNYCFERTKTGSITIKSDYEIKPLLWIRVTNIPAILFSIGFLIPWARIRRYKYLTDNITINSNMKLNEFQASNAEVSSIGYSTDN